jgi:hypothetical protein
MNYIAYKAITNTYMFKFFSSFIVKFVQCRKIFESMSVCLSVCLCLYIYQVYGLWFIMCVVHDHVLSISARWQNVLFYKYCHH